MTSEELPPKSTWKRWLFAFVPLIGVTELALHVKQTRSAPTDAEWERARLEVKAMVKPNDLVVFAPDWVDPLAREKFGEEIATVEREARPDDTRFGRAIEVSMRGQHAVDRNRDGAPEFTGWRISEAKNVGPFLLTTYENPAPFAVVDDLVAHMASGKMHVFRVDRDNATACPRQHTGSQTGGIGFGPGIPATRYACQGAFVGVTILPDLNYVPHQCFFAPPPGGSAVTRIVFDDVHFGRALHGHHAISVHNERDLTGAPVTLIFRAFDQVLGKYMHRDGEGWKGFEADTTSLAGQTGELTVEISSTGNGRQYCFEADTR